MVSSGSLLPPLVRQVLIPISLYVSIEFVKLGQIYFIHNDLELYHEQLDSRIQCRAFNITEDLGQIQYLFSDKTGTLTENKMVFRRCSVFGVEYPHVDNGEDTKGLGLPGPGVRVRLLDCRVSSHWLWSPAGDVLYLISNACACVCACAPALRLQVYEADRSEVAVRSLSLRSGCSRRSLSCRSLSCNRSSVSLHTLAAESEDEEQLCGPDQNQNQSQSQARTSAFCSRVVRTSTSVCSLPHCRVQWAY